MHVRVCVEKNKALSKLDERPLTLIICLTCTIYYWLVKHHFMGFKIGKIQYLCQVDDLFMLSGQSDKLCELGLIMTS